VRTLAHDLGARLGCGAALASLRRTRSEPYALERAVTLDELEALPASEVWSRAGLPLDDALAVLPAIALEPAEAEAIGFGLTPRRSGAPFAPEWISAGPRSLVFRDAEGVALALGEIVTDPAETSAVRLRAHVVFPWAVREGRP
jgi:tRNA pseudouridine55 synthase